MPPDLRLSWSAAKGPKPAKLVMPVRSRSPAPIFQPRSGAVSLPPVPSSRGTRGPGVPHTCHKDAASCALLPSFGVLRWLLHGGARVAHERAERLGDGLVTIAGGVLVDHRRVDAGVAEPGHQLLERGARRGREGASGVPQIVEMKVRQADRPSGLVPSPVEV